MSSTAFDAFRMLLLVLFEIVICYLVLFCTLCLKNVVSNFCNNFINY